MNGSPQLSWSVGLIAAMVAGYLISWIPGFDPNVYGLVPRTFGGLVGIATMPFLHAGLGHLLANLSSLVVLLGFLLVFHSNKAFEVVLEVILLGGILLWLFGRLPGGGERLLAHLQPLVFGQNKLPGDADVTPQGPQPIGVGSTGGELEQHRGGVGCHPRPQVLGAEVLHLRFPCL